MCRQPEQYRKQDCEHTIVYAMMTPHLHTYRESTLRHVQISTRKLFQGIHQQAAWRNGNAFDYDLTPPVQWYEVGRYQEIAGSTPAVVIVFCFGITILRGV